MSDDLKLGYIGLGNQGAPMAKRYLDWPGGLTVFDVRTDAMTPFAEGGATAAASIAEVADADLISITVLDDAQVREVISGEGGLAAHAKPGTIIAIHSTISHTTAVELAQELKPHGIHIADAPVSGGGKAADKGELAVMVGADDETFERIKEPFSRWASVVIHAGEPGDGTKMKLARNMLTFIIYSAVGESQKLADEAGLNLNDLAKVVRHSDALTGGASSIMYRSDSKPLAPDHFLYQPFLHTRALGEKDLSLALELGESLSVDLPFTRLALEKFAANLGVPHADTETPKEA
jgi:3-hydroxyisobutyrate dehydrogenase-like beta-hydroxyacid dehydrogenase